MSGLSQKNCIPCQGGIPPLAESQASHLLNETPGWSITEGKLVREFKFKDFKGAIAFINQVADIAESQNHHPDINLYGYNKVRLTLFTHKINGLHENDFILAARINMLDQLANPRG